jgi:hypothetical protein
MAALLGRTLDMDAVGSVLERNLEAALQMDREETSLAELLRRLDSGEAPR